MLPMKSVQITSAAVVLVLFASHPSRTAWGVQADYPNKTMRLLVGFARGGGTDIVTRIVGGRGSGKCWGSRW